MNKNYLYEFEAKNIIKNNDGDSTTVVKKFAILKPNRRLREDGELFFATETSRFAKAGVLPKAAWGTILSNGGGSISDKEREVYGNLLLKFRDASFELQSILIKGEADRTDVEKLRSDELIIELDTIRNEIQSFESSQISIFENTAEAKARNRAILWWVMNLSFENDGTQYKPIFVGDSFEDKLLIYDAFEDEENKYEFLLSVIRRITYLVTLWFLGRAETNEDFKNFDNNFTSDVEEDNTETLKQDTKELVTKSEETIVKIEDIQKTEGIIEEIKPE